MTLRVLAGLSLALGSIMLIAFFYWVGESPISGGAERHLREMKERTSAPASYAAYTSADFSALPHGRPVAAFEPLEGHGVSFDGYVYFMHQSSDGDYHMSLSPGHPRGWPPDSLRLTAELTPQWQRGSSNWQWEPLLTALRSYSRGKPWPGGPRRARISGWLLYDFQYDEPFVKNQRPRLQPEGPHFRLTGWEIHPVTRIEIWDDSLSAFVEYPR